MTCQIVNPTKEEIIIKLDYKPYRVCSRSSCGILSLNGNPIFGMVHLAPGTNELKQTQLMTPSYNPSTSALFTNYDNDYSVFIENCKADLE